MARVIDRMVVALGFGLALVGLYLLVTWLMGERDATRAGVGLVLLAIGLPQLAWGVRRLSR